MNDSGEIRTHDRPLRRRMLYPAELPNHRNVIYYTTWKRKMSNKIYEKIVKTFSLLKEHVNSSWNQLWTFNKKYMIIKAFKDYSGEISHRTNRLAWTFQLKQPAPVKPAKVSWSLLQRSPIRTNKVKNKRMKLKNWRKMPVISRFDQIFSTLCILQGVFV